MFTPVSINLTIYRGATFLQSFRLVEGTAPFDLTCWTGRMQIREDIESSTPIVDLTTDNGGIIITVEKDSMNNITSSSYTIYIKDTKTDEFNVTSGVYDIELINANGDVGRIQQGNVTIVPNVTR